MVREGVGSAETHISILVFQGARVLKFRKPVRFDFVDFSSLDARAADCRREVELNSRLAPDVYLGVANVVLGGTVLDHAVVMRCLPSDRSLAHLAANDPVAVPDAELQAVANVLARFHATAERSADIAACATSDALADQFEANRSATARFVGPVLPREVHRAVVDSVQRYLAGRGPLLSARIGGGHILDGHGDLQADDIYCLEDGPRILDCLEFDDRLRYGDAAADVAFLAMDLERLGAPAWAARFVRHYEQASGTRLPVSLLHFYIATRAYIRVKVACLRHEQGAAAADREAVALLELARAHLDRGRVRLILVGGPPGSGKSTLAGGLGSTLGASVLRTDEIRVRMTEGPVRPDGSGFREGRYRPEATEAVYGELLAEAARRLGLGETVVLDASWTDETRRREARSLATRSASDLVEFCCQAPQDLRERRISERLEASNDPSEATVETARAMAEHTDEWPSAVLVDTSAPEETGLADALRVIRVS